MNFKNIHVLQTLEIPDASLIKQLERKITTFTNDHGFFKEDPSLSNSNIGSSLVGSGQADIASSILVQRSPLFEALWICHQEFKQVEKQSFAKRIFLFTDCDSPGSMSDQNMALQRAKVLEQLNVDIELFPLPQFSQMRPMFDIKRFYANIISFDEEEIANGQLNVEDA